MAEAKERRRSQRASGDAKALAESGGAPASAHYRDHRQRLRQRFLAGDPEQLPDYELLELLLFHSIDRVDVKPLAKTLLDDFGSFGAVLAAPADRLTSYGQVGERTLVHFRALREAMRRLLAADLRAAPVLSSSQQVADYCRVGMGDQPVESFRILFLNRRNMLIADEVQQRGTVDHTPVYPREVIKRALQLGATALILVHNHPSGDPTPSRADIDMTREVAAAAIALDIAVHDHLIVARGGITSLRSLGLM